MSDEINDMLDIIEKGQLAIKWRLDVERGEMIECTANGQQYCRTHLTFRGESRQEQLNGICCTVNAFFERAGSPLRVTNYMGELRPDTAR